MDYKAIYGSALFDSTPFDRAMKDRRVAPLGIVSRYSVTLKKGIPRYELPKTQRDRVQIRARLCDAHENDAIASDAMRTDGPINR